MTTEKMPWWACAIMWMLFMLGMDHDIASGHDYRALFQWLAGTVFLAVAIKRFWCPCHSQGGV